MLKAILSILEKFTENNEENIVKKCENILSGSNIKLRHEQVDILTFLFQSKTKFKAIEAPTGTGKTLCYILYSSISDYDHIIISTFTKNLQDQIVSEFKKFMKVTPLILKGRKNYICLDKVDLLPDKERQLINDKRFIPPHIAEKVSVSPHYCRKDYQEVCPYKDKCEYLQLKSRMLNERFIIVNHFLLPTVVQKYQDKKIMLIIDECHMLQKISREVSFSEEDLIQPSEPTQENHKSLREYNLSLENYYKRLEKFKLSQKLKITTPGVYELTVDFDFLKDISEVLFFSGTLPEDLPIPTNELDTLCLKDKRNWSNVKITVKDINYKMKDYYQVLKKVISYSLKTYDKTIILCTSHSQLDWVKSNFPEVLTSKEVKPFYAVQKLLDREVRAIAGTDVFWTGIDIPGEKCIIMTKLPFPAPENTEKDEESFITGFQEMFKKFKQGIGRMLRSPHCKGEIIILDNRISRYNDLVSFLEEIKNKGATVIYECTPQTPQVKLKVMSSLS